MERRLIESIFDQATGMGAEFVEVYMEEKTSVATIFENSKVEDIYQNTDTGIGIRVLNGKESAYGYTNDLEKEAILSLAKRVGESVQGKGNSVILAQDKAVAEKFDEVEHFSLDDQVNWLKMGDQCLSEKENVKQSSLSISDVHQKVTIANTEGCYVEDERYRRRANARVILDKDGDVQTGYASYGVTGEGNLFMEKDFNGLCEEAYHHGSNLLSAMPCKGGRLPVVMASSAGGTMVHEACGHGLEADLVERGISAYKDKLETEVASPEISVIDDGAMASRFGTSYYDDEGYKTQENVLIDHGILKRYMCDLHTSKKNNWAQTGNGRRESYRHKPQTRMTTTYIKPGNEQAEDIIKGVKEGLLVTKMGGGQVDVLSGDYVFDVSEGYWINNGEISHAVRGATLAGNGPKSLRDVSQVGSDLGFGIGVCGKGGQGAPVADAQPTMRIENLVIGGVISDDEIIS